MHKYGLFLDETITIKQIVSVETKENCIDTCYDDKMMMKVDLG